jgi:hypothetical protein
LLAQSGIQSRIANLGRDVSQHPASFPGRPGEGTIVCGHGRIVVIKA